MSRYAILSREQLAVLVPELLLIGQLIDAADRRRRSCVPSTTVSMSSPTTWSVRVVRRAEPQPEPDEVAVARVSTGASFVFEPRRSILIAPV